MAPRKRGNQTAKRVSDWVRFLRSHHGWTQHDLALRLGITHVHVCRLECGTLSWTLGQVEAVAEIFGLDPSWLFHRCTAEARARAIRSIESRARADRAHQRAYAVADYPSVGVYDVMALPA